MPSPLQFVKSITSQTNAAKHTLCNQCFHFISKDIKSKNFVNKYPSFLWNFLVVYVDVYSGEELWCMILTTIRPWWISVITNPCQQWSDLHGQHISLFHPWPKFDEPASGLTIFLNDVESGHPGQFAKPLKKEKKFLPNFLCPFGCLEYCFKGSHVAWDLVSQCLLLKVLLSHININRYFSVQQMWDQYDVKDTHYNTILLNKGWEIRPAALISETGCPQVVTCCLHGGGSKCQVLNPPCYPDHQLSAKYTDQLSPIVLQPRIARTTCAKEFWSTLGMSHQFLHFSSIISCNISLHGNSRVSSELCYSHESPVLAGVLIYMHCYHTMLMRARCFKNSHQECKKSPNVIFLIGTLIKYIQGSKFVLFGDSIHSAWHCKRLHKYCPMH